MTLISIALDRSSYDAFMEVTGEARFREQRCLEVTSELVADVEPNPYIRRILTEEVEKQFPEHYRPFIELVLNAMDARKSGMKDYSVDIQVADGWVQVTDQGVGMDLEHLMKVFLVPFSTEKRSGTQYGRFGVGFFSNLEFLLRRPERTRVVVETATDRTAGRKTGAIRVEFTSNGYDVEDIVCSLERTRRPGRGTTVTVMNYPLDQDELGSYLSRYLAYFDRERASIMVNGECINRMESHLDSGREYRLEGEFPLPYLQEKGRGVVRTLLNPEEVDRRPTSLYSQGVLVRDAPSLDREILVDFPAAVELVEGRDGFRTDEAYHLAVESFYLSLVDYAAHMRGESRILEPLREIFPLMVEHLIESRAISGGEISPDSVLSKYIPPLKATLMEGKEYSVHPLKRLLYGGFFGEGRSRSLFTSRDTFVQRFWEEHLADEERLVEDDIKVLWHAPSLHELLKFNQRSRLGLQNLDILLGFGVDERYNTIELVEVVGGDHTMLPLLGVMDRLMVNVAHESLKTVDDFQGQALLVTNLFLCMHGIEGEERLEDMFREVDL